MRFSYLLIMVACLFSCHPQAEKSNKKKTKIEDSLFGYMKSKAEQFSMPIESMSTDSNELVFYYCNRFDTSILVHIKKRKNYMYGIVYQVAIPYYQLETEFDEPIKNPQYFEGFSYYVDSTQWRQISKAADSILDIKTMDRTNMPFDNPYYALAFNSKAKSNISEEDDVMMKEFLTHLKHTFLYNWMSKKPKWTREDLKAR